ncbi:MAG: hypothetical protein HYZ45_01110 [Burkholderiales bacterium]|nr:hypothetical protein [Burkholderiales bacterium]
MKSQDILLLLKILSLSLQEKSIPLYLGVKWKDWEEDDLLLDPELVNSNEILSLNAPQRLLVNVARQDEVSAIKSLDESFLQQYSLRELAVSTGISKSEVSVSLKRCYEVVLAKPDRTSNVPRVNRDSLQEFLVHGLRYVFPAKTAGLVRGIATAWAAPVLQGKLMSGGDVAPVWPDARGNTRGESISPLFKSVPYAAKRDPYLYGLLALTDSLRLGLARERKVAAEQLALMLEIGK